MSFDADRQLVAECRDLIQTVADRERVNYWVEELNRANEVGQHFPALQARMHLREFQRFRRGETKEVMR